ncbi:MAG: Asp-tRNA(Asn)/Glu-tRNA(Gln) amidotransferase subunit GatA [Nitrosopumilaceae archaeon]|nr:Asp-tRNA(Asn)/Glu-tRNA(Gln) amidotransferase subunit GatA [Nitrosopumilaceae archaeon]
MDLEAPAHEIARLVSAGSVSAEEVIERTLERMRDTERLNIFISTNPDAVSEARRIDGMVRDGSDPGRLAGVPVSIKDNICTRAMPTTCASRMLEGYVSPYEATVVERLRREGAIIVGKTNLDEFAMGLTTEFSAYGPTLNPRDPRYVPGGSSGGSAASVAAGAAAISLGSDTGGSVRNPASFCGVAGFKPTYGMVSRYGLVSYANSIEQVGPLARTIPDIVLAMQAISGPDPRDGTTAGARPVSDTEDIVDGKRIGIVRQMAPDSLHPGVRTVFERAVSGLESLGAACEEVSLEMVDYSVAAYYTITSTEAGSNLARYDNIRYGYGLEREGYEFHRYVAASRDRFGPEVKRRIIAGGFVPSAGYAGRYFLKALKVKSRLTREVNRLFGTYDYLVSPTVPVPPFRLGEMLDDPVELFQLDINTVAANLAGKPAVSVPCGTCDGLPVGVQLIADSFRDGPLLGAARALEGVVQ